MKGNIKVIQENKYARNIFALSTFFGIFPYHVKDGYFCVSIPFCLISCVNTGIVVLQFLIALAPDYFGNLLYQPPKINIPMNRIVLTSLIFSFFMLYFFSTVTSIFKASSVNEIISSLNEIDRLLTAADFWKQRRTFGIRRNSYIGCILLFFFVVYTPWLARVGAILEKISMILLVGCICLTAAQFSAIGYLISDRLEVACAVLDDLRYLAPYSLRKNKMTTLTIIHSKLCDVCSVLESAYTKTLTLLIAVSFFAITSSLFLIASSSSLPIKSWINDILPTTRREYAEPMLMLLFIAISLHSVHQLASCCSQITRKIRDFNALLYFIVSTDTTAHQKIVCDDLLRLHVTMKREFVFTACGFFNLDFTLLHSIMVSATTYLVILLQYQ